MADRFNRRDSVKGNLRQTANLMPSTGNNNPINMNGNTANNGCPGNCNRTNGATDSAYKETLHRLQALDFSIIETVLYLDAYPDSSEALAYYKKLVSEREALTRSLAERYHMPLTNMDNASGDSWDWVNAPWPWEASAN